MAYSEELAARVSEFIGESDGVTSKNMFGGVAFMLKGNMCCGIVGDDLMVRVGPAGYEDALSQPGARTMDFTGRPSKGMVFVASDAIRSREDLAAWIQRGVDYAASLPAK